MPAGGTLRWDRAPDATGETRMFDACVWNGHGSADALEDLIAVE